MSNIFYLVSVLLLSKLDGIEWDGCIRVISFPEWIPVSLTPVFLSLTML